MNKQFFKKTFSKIDGKAPLISKRIKVVLSNPKDAQEVANAIRYIRMNHVSNNRVTIKLSEETKNALKKDNPNYIFAT